LLFCTIKKINKNKKNLGLEALKPKQRESYISGNDTFVILPTGYGKSVIYEALPVIFEVKIL